MGTLAAIKSIMQDYNLLITQLITERDRIAAMTDTTLPGGRSLWVVIPAAVQTSLKTDVITKIRTAQTAIDNVVVGIESL